MKLNEMMVEEDVIVMVVDNLWVGNSDVANHGL